MDIYHFGQRNSLGFLICFVLLLSGCSGNNVRDKFVFGKNRISCNNTTITVLTPFELIANGKQAEISDRNADKIMAEGHNQHIRIFVMGDKNTINESISAAAESAETLLRNNKRVTNLKVEKADDKFNNEDAKVLRFSYVEKAREEKTALTVNEYIFLQDEVIWRVIYQYRTEDPIGRELSAQVAGRIQIGAVF